MSKSAIYNFFQSGATPPIFTTVRSTHYTQIDPDHAATLTHASWAGRSYTFNARTKKDAEEGAASRAFREEPKLRGAAGAPMTSTAVSCGGSGASGGGRALPQPPQMLPPPLPPLSAARNRIQEILQARGVPSFPHFVDEATGPQHAPIFRSTISHPTWSTSYEGWGATKVDAQSAAASAALAVEPSLAPAPARAVHVNPSPAAAARAVFFDVENVHIAFDYVPRSTDFVLGFVHSAGTHAVSPPVFPVETTSARGRDAADVALLWRIAALVHGDSAASLRNGAPIYLVSNDHIFATTATVLNENGRVGPHVVHAVTLNDFMRAEREFEDAERAEIFF